jgi:FdhD protein
MGVVGAPPIVAPPPFVRLPRIAYAAERVTPGLRSVAEETAIAFVYGGSTHAVMMATPDDLEDFAVGFSLTERIVDDRSAIRSLAVIGHAQGIELQMWLDAPAGAALTARHRRLAGPTGCGLCGIDSLVEAMRTPPRVTPSLEVTPTALCAAAASLRPRQALFEETRAVHAAGLYSPAERRLLLLREDVGRHNALDKLVGAAARAGLDAGAAILVLTSRVSVEMVQKAAILGTPVVVAVSAPTALAVRTAEAAGMTLAAIARGDAFEVFTHAERVAESHP